MHRLAIVRSRDAALPDGTEMKRPSHNLPAQVTPLVGRDALAESAGALLHPGGVRLLTLTGPGGVGKTRLALRVAELLLPHFADGVVFVPLAPLTDPDQVLFAVANPLEMAEEGTNRLSDLTRTVRHKRILLLLDNFEHLLSAAPLVSELLAAGSGVKVLATSREPLHLYGEREFPVPPLTLPDTTVAALMARRKDGPHARDWLMEVSHSPAVALLVERAQTVNPAFQMTAENAPALIDLCHRLDGLPLALELAAARLKFATPQALMVQIDRPLSWLTGKSRDLPVRQQTMRHAIDWSYRLLDEGEQRLFARLAVFPGSFTLSAADTVCNPDRDLPFTVEEGVQGLVEKSLLRFEVVGETPRVSWLATIRAYAFECLSATGEAGDLQERHARYVTALAEEAEPHLWGATQQIWLDRLRAEEDNWRVALMWTLKEGAGETSVRVGVRLAMSLRRFWEIQGRFTEARLWLERALTFREMIPPPSLARLFNLLGSVVQFQGLFDEARAYHQQALQLAEALNDAGLRATTLQLVGMVAGRQGDYREAERVLSHVVLIERQGNNSIQLSVALNNLALAVRELGDYGRAATLLEESLALKRARGDGLAIAATLANLGALALLNGDPARAFALQREGLELRQQLGDLPGSAVSLCNMAGLALAQQEGEAAARLYAAADALLHSLNTRMSVDVAESFTRNVTLLQTMLGTEAFAAAWQEGREMSLTEAIAGALLLVPATVEPPPVVPPVRGGSPTAAVLTPREREVLRWVAMGLSDAEVAARLVVSPRTVSTHLHRIYSKLEVPSRTAAARYAVEHGLV